MYLTYLNHYNIRQCKAQYLSVLYEILGKNLDSYFILTDEYLEKYNRANRWEVRWAEENWGSYEKLYEKLTPQRYTVMKKPEFYFNTRIPSELLYKTVNEAIKDQEKVIENIVNRKDIKAGLTWVNNKCFRDTLAKYNINTIHHEMGPFRPSCYIPTIYLDFSGVNGDTEFDDRFKEFLKIANEVPILSRKELIRIISPNNYHTLYKILENKDRTYEIGVGLQVEVDTNLLLFNNGRNWIDPILSAKADSVGKVLVRPHPSSGYIMKPDVRLTIDDLTKGNAQDFINKCDKIYCLNSSVGFEAILLGREAKIFGDSPFKNICKMNEEEKILALNFAIFGYLIHRNFLFNESYYDFRLGCLGDEKAIYMGNMERLLREVRK